MFEDEDLLIIERINKKLKGKEKEYFHVLMKLLGDACQFLKTLGISPKELFVSTNENGEEVLKDV